MRARRRSQWRLAEPGGVGRAAAFAAFLAASVHALPLLAAELALEANSGCIHRDDLIFQVERALGQPLAALSNARFLVRVLPAARGFRAELAIVEEPGGTPRGFRSLVANTCDELTPQVALALALALGEGLGVPEPPPAPAEPSRAPVNPAIERAAAPAAPAEGALASDAERAGPKLAASAWLIGDTGTLPAMGWGLGAGVGLGWPGFGLRALGTLLPERKGTIDPGDPSSPGAEIGLLAGSVLGCLPVALSQAALELAVCAGGEVGALSGNGTGVSTAYQQRTVWAAARVDVAARWALAQTPLALEALLTAAAPLSRDDFALRDIGSVHRPESVIGRASLGVCLFID